MRAWRLAFFLIACGIWPPARGADYPEFATGQSDLKFEEAAPQSSDAELTRRFGATETPPAYDIAKEKFRVLVPGSYKHEADGWGLFVWIDASPVPTFWGDWGPVLAEKKLIFVGAHDTGNMRDRFDRFRLAIDAVHNMKRRFHVDPERVYVSGCSGGGRMASMLGVACADVFAGSFPMVGVNFYKPIATGKGSRFWPPSYQPDPGILARAKARGRFVLLTGETDFNRENTKRIYRGGFKAEKFRHVLYVEVPGLGHSRPSAEWVAKGIQFLDDEGPKR